MTSGLVALGFIVFAAGVLMLFAGLWSAAFTESEGWSAVTAAAGICMFFLAGHLFESALLP